MNPQFSAASRQIIGGGGCTATHPASQQSQHRPAPSHLSLSTAPHRHRGPHRGLLQRQHSDDSESQSSSKRRHEHQQQQQHHHPRGPQHVRSKSIPIHPSSGEMKRTPSEQQLHEDEAMADYRDLVMFRRIAEGIKRRQRDTTHRHPRMVNELCLASIIDTRSLTEDELVMRNEEDRTMDKLGHYQRNIGTDHHHHHPHRLLQRDSKTTSYLDPSTCKWIIATNPTHYHHQDPQQQQQHYNRHLSSAKAAAGLGFSEAVSSPEDEMLFPLEL
jgi:hypothetical protein